MKHANPNLFKPALLGLAIIALLAWAAPAPAQVRTNVDGNALPDAAPADASAIERLAHRAHGTMSRARHNAFADAVDVDAFSRLAVFDGGRVKIIDTLAREQIDRFFGKQRFKDLETGKLYDPTFTYLDLVFNQPYYLDKPVIYVEVLPLRRRLVRHLPADEQEAWLRRARLSPRLLNSPPVQAAFRGLDADLRLFKAQQDVMFAAQAFANTGGRLHLISPAPGGDHWAHVADLTDTRTAAAGETGPGVTSALLAADPGAARAAADAFHRLAHAWRDADADAVNQQLAALVDALPRINPATYPAPWRLQLEALYNGSLRYVLSWIGYFIATVCLILAFSTGRRWVIGLGASALFFAFAVNTLTFAARTLLSGRWPIHNQYESFFAIAWFAVGVGIVLMMLKKQWLFGAAAAALGFCSMMFANTVAIPSREVAQVAGILGTSRILYVHVNMVLVSYALIGLSFFISLFYLGVHYLKSRQAVRIAAAGVGAVDDTGRPARGREALLNDLDKAQMVVMQLAFWLLGFGILLGAYWADHAWGRWWAWDPKETWALITWIVYLIAIHTRFGVKDRGLVTAWLSVCGFIVMLWTYWGVNLLLAGLHSYA